MIPLKILKDRLYILKRIYQDFTLMLINHLKDLIKALM